MIISNLEIFVYLNLFLLGMESIPGSPIFDHVLQVCLFLLLTY